ncbi:putative amidohydrolase [Umbelopsis sp. AD052]|nr:putative amidohydrolase [Umbelopsis sp. AD052]
MKVAVAQVGTPASWKPEDAIAQLDAYAKDAAEQGVEHIVFPEAYIGGYPKGSTFGAYVGNRTIEGRKEFARYYNGAITVPGPHVDQLAEIANKHGLFMVVGVIEREEHGGTLYCTAVFIHPDQGCVGKHRKLMPTGSERLIWGCGDGSTLPVIETQAGVRTSATICWENYMPLLRAHYYSKGVQLYCAPTVDDRTVWASTMTHIALEGRCFVLSACQFTKQSHYPDGHPFSEPKDPNAIVIAGGSMIIGPLGNVLAGPLRETEGLLVADIDLDDILGGKFDMDVSGHYSRSDVFGLMVDEREQTFRATN